jgi:hypothetical protein
VQISQTLFPQRTWPTRVFTYRAPGAEAESIDCVPDPVSNLLAGTHENGSYPRRRGMTDPPHRAGSGYLTRRADEPARTAPEAALHRSHHHS